MRDRNHLGIEDVLYLPATYLLAYLLSRWLPGIVATPVAVILVLGVGCLLAKKRGAKGTSWLLPVLAAGAVTFILRLLGWPD